MREDMARVLVGRPRGGARLRLKRRKLHQRQTRRPEETLRREPMSRSHGSKWLNENLSPLVRYLRSQVGRPWNDVYSEISERLRTTNAVQQHVRDHLQDYVILDTRLEGRKVVTGQRRGFTTVLTEPGYSDQFYVDPRTGALRERKRKSWQRRVEVADPDVRWDGPCRQLRRIDAIWYAFRLAPIPEGASERARLRDRLFGRSLEELARAAQTSDTLFEAYGRRGVYAAEKRQLSRRQLRAITRLPMSRKWKAR